MWKICVEKCCHLDFLISEDNSPLQNYNHQIKKPKLGLISTTLRSQGKLIV